MDPVMEAADITGRRHGAREGRWKRWDSLRTLPSNALGIRQQHALVRATGREGTSSLSLPPPRAMRLRATAVVALVPPAGGRRCGGGGARALLRGAVTCGACARGRDWPPAAPGLRRGGRPSPYPCHGGGGGRPLPRRGLLTAERRRVGRERERKRRAWSPRAAARGRARPSAAG